VSRSSGYTRKQDQRLKDQINRDLAAIDDRAYAMRRRVTDHSVEVDTALDQLHQAAYDLCAIIDRRTQA